MIRCLSRRVLIAAAVTWTLPAQTPAGFGRTQTLSLGAIRLLGIGDVNGDRNGDAVYLTQDGRQIGVLLWRNSELAQPPVLTTVAQPARAGLVADFTGDGLADVAVISGEPSQSSTVTLYRATGAGSLTGGAPVASINVGFPPILKAADVNGDGRLDLAGVLPDFGTLFFHLNQGGTFGPLGRITDPTLSGPGTTEFTVGDVNADGRPDAVIARTLEPALGPLSGSVRVYTGDGTGIFRPGQILATPMNSNHVVLGDFSGDGVPDLALATWTPPNGPSDLRFFRGTGNGSFATIAASTVTLGPGAVLRLAAADQNGDGRLDLAAVSADGPRLLLQRAPFDFDARLPAERPGAAATDARLGDFDNDGRLDALLVGPLVTEVYRQGAKRRAELTLRLPNFTIAAATPVSITATLTAVPGAGPANGVVTFFQNGVEAVRTPLLPAPPAPPLNTPILVGTASMQTAFLVGTHTLSATFSGSTDFEDTAASPVTLTVGPGLRMAPKAAPLSIVSLYGTGLTPGEYASSNGPPVETLAGVTVTVRDARGVERPARLFYADNAQINLLMPDVALGAATLTVRSGGGRISAAVSTQVDFALPALYTARGDGTGPPAALLVRARADGSSETQTAFECGATILTCAPRAVEFAPGETVVLVLFGTGMRKAFEVLYPASAEAGGVELPVLFAGPQPEVPGLDQVNVQLTPALAGRGDIDLSVAVAGERSNGVRLRIR